MFGAQIPSLWGAQGPWSGPRTRSGRCYGDGRAGSGGSSTFPQAFAVSRQRWRRWEVAGRDGGGVRDRERGWDRGLEWERDWEQDWDRGREWEQGWDRNGNGTGAEIRNGKGLGQGNGNKTWNREGADPGSSTRGSAALPQPRAAPGAGPGALS